ncbi:hypothetical protein SUGI_0156240 [Cryptomeria japonica]|nr:hypothetical protein SUGI_0156240 [Cryptomeria japonica]
MQHLGRTGVHAHCLGWTVAYVLGAPPVRARCCPRTCCSAGTVPWPGLDKNANRQKVNSNSIATLDEKIKKGATPGLPGRSPIPVLLRPKHALLQSSDGIRCTNVGMISPVMRMLQCVLSKLRPTCESTATTHPRQGAHPPSPSVPHSPSVNPTHVRAPHPGIECAPGPAYVRALGWGIVCAPNPPKCA